MCKHTNTEYRLHLAKYKKKGVGSFLPCLWLGSWKFQGTSITLVVSYRKSFVLSLFPIDTQPFLLGAQRRSFQRSSPI